MSLIIIGKVAVGSLGAASVGVGGFLLHRFLNPIVEIYGFVSTETSVTDSKFKCKMSSFQEFDCIIKEIQKLDKTTDSKQHIQLGEILEKSDSIDIEEKFFPTKFYKITIAESVFSSPTPTTQDATADWKSITVSNKDSETTLATFTSIFSLKGKVPSFLGSTNSFIGQASEAAQSITDNKCYWEELATTPNLKDCKIYPFVKDDETTSSDEGSDISALTFKKTDTKATQTKAKNYYLITFEDSHSVPDLEKWTSKEIIYAANATDTASKVTFNKIYAVKPVGEQLLILKQHS